MKKVFSELEIQDIRWVKTSRWRQDYELRTGEDEVLASLRRTSWWRRRAEVEAAGNRWTFDRKGAFRQRIEIQSMGTGESPAIFTYPSMRFDRGRLEYPDGRVYMWRSNFWGNRWAWTTEDGEPLMGFQVSGVFKTKGAMSMDPDLEDGNVPSLLLFLGWYLITLYQEDVAVVAST